MIAEWRTAGVKEQLCSGTLISSTVYLTAAHCTAYLESLGISQVWVSFDVDVDPVTSSTKLYAGTMHTHPGYPGPSSDPKDIAVITFAKPIKGITPASLPTAGLFDQMKKAGTLNDQLFTAVGYGVHEPETGAGGPTWEYDGERWRSVSSFNALNDVWLRLSQNNATGDGGTCYGDSGGPNFLGTGSETVPGTVASITVTGDYMCTATNDTYRVDTKSARDFLGTYVTLP
ncbi:MAG: trypsin-like serine protease [Actinobacteria bacterium]|nr:trypsin-like serine protease [Actinomycetota bacterium]